MAVLLFAVYSLTAPQNHSEAEDVYDFALQVEQGTFADQAGVNRVLALPVFGVAYKTAQAVGYSGRAFPFMIFMNRLLAVGCVLFFWRLLGGVTALPALGRDRARPSTNAYCLFPATLLFSFSYGFWRYANEAETYILASFLVLGAWCFALSGKWVWSVWVSVLGIMVHLLNLIPLLLIIPLYYLLSKEWKKAVMHGVLTGLLVVVGYAICSSWLDFSELGAQHHALEGGVGVANIARGGIAFGQNLVSANFLFGFESFRELLSTLFPSRMLDEEFYMASKMGSWIPQAGVVTVVALLGVGVWVCVKFALECGSKRSAMPLSYGHEDAQKEKRPLWRNLHRCVFGYGSKGERESGSKGRPDVSSAQDRTLSAQCLMPNAFVLSTIVWLLLYAFAVIRTEAGSPELWIMALIPFWLLVALCLKQFIFGHTIETSESNCVQESQDYSRGRKTEDGGRYSPSTKHPIPNHRKALWGLVILLFAHNLIAGLLPVMQEKTDYHAAKGKWLVENSEPDDLILTDYEPVMIFYLDYFTESKIINSGQLSLNQIKETLGSRQGNAYAVASFFQPMESMRVRSPKSHARMKQTGAQLFPSFGKIVDDDFGGIYCHRQSMGVAE